MSRPTEITAAEWETIADDVFDTKVTVTFGGLEVLDVMPHDADFVIMSVYSERIGFDKVKVRSSEVLDMRWLATAAPARLPEYQPTDTDIREAVAQTIPASPPAPEIEAGENVWSVNFERLNLAAYLSMQFGYTWNDNNSCATNVRLAIDNLQRQLEDTNKAADMAVERAERDHLLMHEAQVAEDEAKRQLAAAQAEVARLRTLLDITQTDLRLIELGYVGDLTPSIMAGVALRKTMSNYSSQDIERYKQNALNATPATPPDVAALVAACEQVISLAPLTKPIWADMTNYNTAVQIAEAGKYAREQAWWQAATILKAALAKAKGE